MGIKSNFEKNMEKATKKHGAQVAVKGGNPFVYDQLLKEKSNKKEHTEETCEQAHPGKTHQEWVDTSVEGEMEEATDMQKTKKIGEGHPKLNGREDNL